MDLKQRDWSAVQSNFILQMMGFENPQPKQNVRNVTASLTSPNLQSHAAACADALSLAGFTLKLTSHISLLAVIVQVDLCHFYYCSNVYHHDIHQWNQVGFDPKILNSSHLQTFWKEGNLK